MRTAYLIKANLPDYHGQANLYRCDPPMLDYENTLHEYVVVSAVRTLYGPETYIFPASADGSVTQFSDLPGSFKGALDHKQALLRAGYDIEEGETK